MATKIECSGIVEFQEKVMTIDVMENVIIYFSATKKEDGIPWCPDCAAADPVVESQLGSLNEKLTLLCARIDRPYWKELDPAENMLKTELNVTCLPSLMRWEKPERLGEDECKNADTVKAFFSSQQPS